MLSFFSAFSQAPSVRVNCPRRDGCSPLRGDVPAVVAGPSDPPHVPTGVAFPLGNPRACPPAPSPLLGGLRVCPATAAPVAPPWGVFSLLFLRLRAFSRVSGSFCVVPSPGRAVAPVAIQCPFLLPACPPLTPPPPFPWGRSLRESWRPMETVLCRGRGRYRCRQLAEAVSADALLAAWAPPRPRQPGPAPPRSGAAQDPAESPRPWLHPRRPIPFEAGMSPLGFICPHQARVCTGVPSSLCRCGCLRANPPRANGAQWECVRARVRVRVGGQRQSIGFNLRPVNLGED